MDESLFYYPDGLGPDNFSFPDSLPLFRDELNLTTIASPELISVCGEDPICLFDGTATGSVQMALESLETEMTIEADLAALGTVTV